MSLSLIRATKLPASRSRRGSPLLEVQPAHEIPLAQGNAIGAQDVVGGGGVEIEIGQRERHQEVFRRERQFALAEREDDVLAAERVDRLRGPARQRLARLRDKALQACK